MSSVTVRHAPLALITDRDQGIIILSLCLMLQFVVCPGRPGEGTHAVVRSGVRYPNTREHVTINSHYLVLEEHLLSLRPPPRPSAEQRS